MALFGRREPGDGRIEWRTERRRLGDLVDWEKNPRQMTEKQAEDLARSIGKFGYVEEIVVNADGRSIIGGHRRKDVILARALMEPEAMVDMRLPSRELSEDEREELAIRLNRNTGGWDFDALANDFEVSSLVEWGFDPEELGLGGDDDEGHGQGDSDDEEITGADITPRMKAGSRALIDGKHVLVCGDSRDLEVLKAAAPEVDFIITSPPYNVGKYYRSAPDDMPAEEYMQLIDDVALALGGVLKHGRFIAWNVGVSKQTLPHRHYALLEARGFTFFRSYSWIKHGTIFPLFNHTKNKARIRYLTSNYNHEWIGLFTKGEAELGSPMEDVPSFLESDVISSIHQSQASLEVPSDPSRGTDRHPDKLHGATFPVALARGIIEHLAGEGEVVLDPFSGSGSTMMAAIDSGRLGCGVEIDPTSCEIALLRAEKRDLSVEIV
ncbi:MAG: DNA modification methylase [Planctomycetota bacterium]|jgi:DNA modification methylase